jgi:hypothetical protein
VGRFFCFTGRHWGAQARLCATLGVFAARDAKYLASGRGYVISALRAVRQKRKNPMPILKWTSAIVVCAGLAACGDTTGEQALVGAGAGVGAALLLDTNPFATAAIGAAGSVIYCEQNPGKC